MPILSKSVRRSGRPSIQISEEETADKHRALFNVVTILSVPRNRALGRDAASGVRGGCSQASLDPVRNSLIARCKRRHTSSIVPKPLPLCSNSLGFLFCYLRWAEL